MTASIKPSKDGKISSKMIGMEIPKFLKCPECEEKYNDKKKRRIIDSCGHPRCFSCLVLDNQCTVCETILGRRRSWISNRDSLLSTDDSQDGSKSDRGSTHELCSKEQYLRTLYSYDPESQEHVYSRRASVDLHARRVQDRQIKLGRYSISALVLPNEIQNSSPTLKKIDDPRRNSLQELIFSRKASAEIQTLPSITSTNKGIIKDENQRRQSLDNSNSSDPSQVISPRSSGYWSEMECYSDQEGTVSQSGNTDLEQDKKENNPEDKETEYKKKRNRVYEGRKRIHSHDENVSIKKTNEDLNELAKINFVLSGSSCAWQNTKALFTARTSCCVAQDRIRRDSEPDSRKYFDSHSNNNRHSSLKVTNI